MKPSKPTFLLFFLLLKSAVVLSSVMMTEALAFTGESNLPSLTLNIERIKQVSGQLHYQVFSCPENKDTTWQQLSLEQSGQSIILQNELSLTLSALDSGQYIVRVFQDLNNNQELDYSRNGIPKEPFGFSTNPNVMLGQPMPINTCFNYPSTEALTGTLTNELTEPLSEMLTIKLNNKRKRKGKNSH